MKKIIVLVILIVSVCLSQTYYMTIEKKDGTNILYPVQSVRLIRFSGIIANVKDQKLANHVISSFKLFQNYPNPFNPSTTIEYQIPKTGLVEIYIFNIQGRLIRKLDNTIRQAGTQEIEWDGRDNYGKQATSGVYFCQVKFSGNTITKKLMLIK